MIMVLDIVIIRGEVKNLFKSFNKRSNFFYKKLGIFIISVPYVSLRLELRLGVYDHNHSHGFLKYTY